MGTRLDHRAVVILVDPSFSSDAFRARLELESRLGPFDLVLGISDELEVTMDMARVFLHAVLDERVRVQRLLVASGASRTRALVQAISLAARYRGSARPVEAVGSLMADGWWPAAEPVCQG
jgi:hypothetical protein